MIMEMMRTISGAHQRLAYGCSNWSFISRLPATLCCLDIERIETVARSSHLVCLSVDKAGAEAVPQFLLVRLVLNMV